MIRVGTGYDAHRLVAGRRLVLGGVEIAFESGLEGHSDADVLAHAVADAVLAAAGLPELGELFPASDPANRGASSLSFLEGIALRLDQAGVKLLNVDATLVADRPALRAHREAMCQNLARALGIPRTAVSVKPKSNEGLGFEGRGEGMSAMAVALVQVRDPSGEASDGRQAPAPRP